MNLIKIGNTIINLDQVAEVSLDRDPGLQLWYVGGSAHFKNPEEVAALRHYLNHASLDIVKQYQDYKEKIARVEREQAWQARVNDWLDTNNVPQDHRRGFQQWLYNDGDLDEPTQEIYSAFAKWSDEQGRQGKYNYHF